MSTSFENVKKAATNAVDTTAEYLKEQGERFNQAAQLRLDQMSTEIKRLEVEAESLSNDARVRWQSARSDLHTRLEKLREHMKAMKSSGGEATEELKQGFHRAYLDVRQAFNKASDELNNS